MFAAGVVPVVVLALLLHLLSGIHIEVIVIVHVAVLLQAEVGGKGNVNLTLLVGVLGGNNNHTVRSAGTIDGSCGGILQHVDAGDIILVDILQTTLDGQSIHNKQRAGLGIE